ncbi:hypothetical protein GCM10023156_48710 [Novipirellula rosea]|uniref:DUF2786 domain-containing protein n=2 Tax=Novipirellula rosea TaxID=1031540 RepID=A0ABP8NCA5_9BACT
MSVGGPLMAKKRKPNPNVDAVRALIRIARSASLSGDDLLLRSAEVELSDYGISLVDIGITTTPEPKEVARG